MLQDINEVATSSSRPQSKPSLQGASQYLLPAVATSRLCSWRKVAGISDNTQYCTVVQCKHCLNTHLDRSRTNSSTSLDFNASLSARSIQYQRYSTVLFSDTVKTLFQRPSNPLGPLLKQPQRIFRLQHYVVGPRHQVLAVKKQLKPLLNEMSLTVRSTDKVATFTFLSLS